MRQPFAYSGEWAGAAEENGYKFEYLVPDRLRCMDSCLHVRWSDMEKYEEMFYYVKEILAQYDLHGGAAQNKINYSRFEHTKRVHRWMMELYEALEDKQGIDIDALKIAAIFHDSGYGNIEEEPHAQAGARICGRYLEQQGYDQERIEFICNLVARHSDKKLLQTDIPLRTKKGKEIWIEKRRIVKEFFEAYCHDLEMEQREIWHQK